MQQKTDYIVTIKNTFTGKESRFCISRTFLLAIKITILLFIILDIGAIIGGVLIYKQMKRYENLRAENVKLKKQLEHTLLLGKEVLKFRKVREKVLTLLGIETEEPPLFSDLTDTLLLGKDKGFNLKGYPTNGVVSRGFSRYHPAVDIAASIGTPVYSPADGIVSKVGEDKRYGKYLEINHPNGYSTFYGHLEKVLVIEGWQVKEGDLIARVGNTGVSTGPHLHFEVRRNRIPVNPAKLITKEPVLQFND